MIPLSVMADVGVPIIVALIAAGLGAWLRDGVKYLHARVSKTGAQRAEHQQVHEAVAAANESVLVVSRSQQQLKEDNDRLRQDRIESDARWAAVVADLEARHARREATWEAERVELKQELDAIEEKWRRALDDLIEFKTRTGLGAIHPNGF